MFYVKNKVLKASEARRFTFNSGVSTQEEKKGKTELIFVE